MKKKFHSIINNQFIQGSLLFTISNIFISLLNYFFNFLAGRSLGPTGYGEIVAFFSYTAIFSIPFTVISSLIIQKISSSNLDHLAFSKSLEFWFMGKLKKWWFISIIFLFIAPFLPKLTNLSPVTSFLIIFTVMLSLFSVFYSSALQGLRIFLLISIIGIITVFIKFLGALAISINFGGLSTILTFLVISSIFNLSAVFFSFKKFVRPRVVEYKIEKRIASAILNPYFFLTAISVISIILLTNFDIIFAKKFFVAKDAGLFAAWSLFAKIVFYLVGPLVTLSFIFFSNKKNIGEQERILAGTLLVLFFVGSACYIAYTFFPFLVEVIFGNKFTYIIDFLPQAAIFGIFFSIINLFNNYFLAKKSLFTLILPLAFPVYIFLLFIFGKDFSGIIKIDVFFGLGISIIYLGAYLLQKMINRSIIIST